MLVAASVIAYVPTFVNGFVAYDDDSYVVANPHVFDGLSWAGLRWAFTTQDAANWHPLTWLSHMLDVQLFGLSAPMHHATSLLIHVAATCVLFAVLLRAGLALGASGFVAGVFALHPTHVESVAWVAERKDVLCALFWFLGLFAWIEWARRRERAFYALAVLAHVLALLSKPMAVGFPLTLILFDVWPLGRLRERSVVALALEKAPFVLLAIGASIATWFAQHAGGAVVELDLIPFADRATNAVVSYAIYLRRFVWPVDLACLYPFPLGGRGAFEVVISSAVLLALAAFAWILRARKPAIWVGLAWFAVTLVPVIGLAQVGLQANADRYTYVPYVGLALAVAAAFEAFASARRRIVDIGYAAVCGVWLVLTFAQTATWRDSLTLFQRAIDVTENNFIAHTNLGDAWVKADALAKGIVELETAVRIRSDYYLGHVNLASAYYQAGRYEDAERVCRAWTAAHGEDATMLVHLATVQMQFGDFAGAEKSTARAIELDTQRITLARNRAIDLALLRGDWAAAAEFLAAELAVEPSDAKLARRLQGAKRLVADSACAAPECLELRAEPAALEREVAETLSSRSRFAEALVHARHAVELTPLDADAHMDLGVHAVRAEDLALAETAFAHAVELAPLRAELHNNLGYVRMQRGELEPARDAFREALRLMPTHAEARSNLADVERRLAGG